VKDSLVRLEYKLDLIIRALMDKGMMIEDLPRIGGITGDTCPVCAEQISIVSDFESEAPIYKCACRLPVTIVPGISTLLPVRNTDAAEGNQEDQLSSDRAPSGDRDR
jgi:hypothetical protein